jgi:hypothetical protein
MSRTVETIQNEIIANKNAEPVLNVYNSPSSVSVWRMWTRVVAISINIFEQLIDIAKSEISDISNSSKAGTPKWYQNRILDFQFDDTIGNEQIVSEIDGVVQYPVIDESLKIIKRASVKELTNGRVFIKVATEIAGELSPISPVQLIALKDYINKFKFVGTAVDSVSLFPDRLYLEGTIYINGQFVSTNVLIAIKSAINTYLLEISGSNNFDGVVVREQLFDRILNVQGVTGIDTFNFIMKGRAEQTPFLSSLLFTRTYEPSAGYLIEETETGEKWDDKLILTIN